MVLSSTELVLLALAAGWISAALAYSLPKPGATSSKVYTTMYKLIQFAHANFDRVHAKTPEE